jgi:hypothetical protein
METNHCREIPLPPKGEQSFFVYYLNRTGGLHDPRYVIDVIEKLKEWLPGEKGFDHVYNDEDLSFNNGWAEYRAKVLRGLGR